MALTKKAIRKAVVADRKREIAAKKKPVVKIGKLDPAFKRKWVKALESGKYKQVCGTLVEVKNIFDVPLKAKGYCCLGVAGALLGETIEDMDGCSALAGHVAKSVGLTNEIQGLLASCNDGDLCYTDGAPLGKVELNPRKRKMTFKSIAKIIRERL